MNRLKKLLIVSCLCLLTSCTSETVSEPETAQPTPVINRLTDNYTVEEVKLPDELIPNDWMNITLFYQIKDYQFRAYILNKSISNLYPVESVYDYNLLTGELNQFEFNTESNIRVMDMVTDNNWKAYELIMHYVDSGVESYVNYEGKLVEGTENLTLSTYNIRGFQKLNDKLYLLLENSVDYDHTVWNLYEFNNGEAKIVYNYATNRTWGLDKEADVEGIILPPIQKNSSHQMGWVMQKEGKYFIQVFAGDTVESYEVPLCPMLVVSLTNGIYYTTYDTNDENEIIRNSFYRLNTDTGESTLISELTSELGMTYQISDQEFYYNGLFEYAPVCRAETDELKCRKIEGIPLASYINGVYSIDDKTDLIYQGSYNDENAEVPSLYLIHWK